MSVSADQLRELLALGLDAKMVLDIVTIFERDASRDGRDGKAKAADRARKYRLARKQNKSGMATQLVDDRHETSRDASRYERDAVVNLSSTSLLPGEPLKGANRKVRTEVVEGRTKKKVLMPLPDDWQPNDAHRANAEKLKLPAGTLESKVEDMRLWAQANDIRKASWDATFHRFLRTAAENTGGRNGFGGPRPLQDDSKSISRAAERLAEKAERGEFTFGPRPSLLPAQDENIVRLLPKG